MPITVTVLKAPAWAGSGIDAKQYIDDAVDELANKLKERQGSGQGARMNTVMVLHGATEARLTTTLRNPASIEMFASFGRGAVPNPRFNPRASGKAWGQHQEEEGKSLAPDVLREETQRPIEAKWRA